MSMVRAIAWLRCSNKCDLYFMGQLRNLSGRETNIGLVGLDAGLVWTQLAQYWLVNQIHPCPFTNMCIYRNGEISRSLWLKPIVSCYSPLLYNEEDENLVYKLRYSGVRLIKTWVGSFNNNKENNRELPGNNNSHRLDSNTTPAWSRVLR